MIKKSECMKSILLSLALFTCLFARSQSSASTLDVVSWNIEWFGASFEDPADDDLQRENARKVLRYLDADLYGLVEMVDTAQIRRLVDSLGSDFTYKISDYCSNATAPGTGAWRNGQKLVFIYKKNIFTNVTARGMLRTSATAYTNWASGRFPYLMNADVTVNGITRNMNFILIHGKAGSSASDYDRRLAGARELKDTLDQYYSSTINFIIGDFNDALNETISTGEGPATSYQPIVVDSTDGDHYRSITLPLAYAGQTSMINFPNVVDNHVISNEAFLYYLAGSAQIRTDITTVVPDYVTEHNTSDHWPVFSKYNLAGVPTGLPTVEPLVFGLRFSPNPFDHLIQVKANRELANLYLRIFNAQGQVISALSRERLTAGASFEWNLQELPRGIYFIECIAGHQRTVVKMVKE